MKKTNKVKMGPLGTPLGNPLGYFNSQKAKRSVEPKQTLRKAQDGIYMGGSKDNPSNVPPTFEQVGIKNTYQGPLNEKDQMGLDRMYPSTAFAPTPSGKGISIKTSSGKIPATKSPKEQGYMTPEAGEQYGRKRAENFLRSDHQNMAVYNKYPEAVPEDVVRSRNMIEAEDRKMEYGDPYKKKGGTHKMPNGKVMLNSKMKKGGATKATKFAALAPPYNKATAADRIVGAKKNAKKK